MKSLLVHVPKGFASESWKNNYINIMPMGLFSIANFATENGYPTKVMNAAVYGNRSDALEIIYERIQADDCQVVGLPLHWHLAGFDVCCAAREIKNNFPGVSIVLGGITASVFHKELLSEEPSLDAVVRGDGEEAYLQYLVERSKGIEDRQYGQVPNLVWRNDGQIVVNSERYAASADVYSSYDFSISKTIWDIKDYANGPSMFDAMAGEEYDFAGQDVSDKVFFLNIGRGCTLDCLYCAGSSVSMRRYFHRPEVIVRSEDSVLEDVHNAVALGFKKFHICFDPPYPGKDEYFCSLFKRIHDQISSELTLYFESYNLPSERFLDACAYCFEHALMIVSPCFFDNEKMKVYKGYHFTREEMEQKLASIQRRENMDCFVYYAITPMDEWSDKEIAEHANYMAKLITEYDCKASAMPILAEPGSPWVSFHDCYGEYSQRLEFADFWAEWKKPLVEWSEKLTGLKGANEIFETISRLMKNDSIS